MQYINCNDCLQAPSTTGAVEAVANKVEPQLAGSARQAKDVVLEYYKNYNAGNVEGVMKLMAPDCQCECYASAETGTCLHADTAAFSV